MSNASQIAALQKQIAGWQQQVADANRQITEANRQIAILQSPPPVTPPTPKPRMWVEDLGAGKARVHWADV